jgi:hypothetical protein
MATQQQAAPKVRRESRAGRALDAETQQQVAELNLRGIALVRAALAAAGPAPAAGSAGAGPPAAVPLPAALCALRREWLALDEAAQGRLAGSPYLLFEFGLSGASIGTAATLSPARVVHDGEASSVVGSVSAAPFAGAEGRVFLRLLRHYAWHLVRSSPAVTVFVLGVPWAALEALRTMSLSCVEALGEVAPGGLRLRWDDQPALWKDWLAAARGDDAAALWAVQLRGLQRIAGLCREAAPGG